MSRIFILDGHPGETSISRQICERYAAAARAAGHEVRIEHLHGMEFDPDFEFGSYSQIKPLEPDLERVMEHVEWCEHMVLASPMWWGGLPAKLKGLIDRGFLPGRTFDPKRTKMGFPYPLLEGRSARVFLTSDTPGLIFKTLYSAALIVQLKRQVFGFCGFKPTRVLFFAGASHPKDGAVDKWLAQAETLGAAAQ